MQKKFLTEFKNETKENLINNFDIIKKIVKCYMKYNYRSDFFKQISNNFEKNFVIYLFIEILINEKKIHEKIKEFLVEYIDKEIKLESVNNLFNIISIVNNRNLALLNKFDKYIIDENSFFSLNEDTKMKLLKLLIFGRVLPNKESQNLFLRKSFEQIEKLKNIIFNFDFSYNEISEFFEKKENNLILKERMGLLYLININDTDDIGKKYDINFEKNKKIIEETLESIIMRYYIIQKDINSIELIINDFNIFYPISHKSESEEFSLLINQYKNKKEFFYKNERIEQIKKEYYEEAKERNKIKDSFLFKSIYEKEKKNFENETKILIASQKKFKEMKEILNMNLSNEKLLKFCIEEFKNKIRDEIYKEISRLTNIFKMDNIQIEELTNKYVLLSYKENIINIVKAMKVFIKQIGAKETEYSTNLNTIIFYCENNNDIEIINFFLDLLHKMGINLKDRNNKFPNILTALEKIPESIDFLLSKKVEDCGILHGIVNDGNGDSFLTSADIIHFEKCVSFMKNLGNIEELKKMSDYELIIKTKDIYNKLEDKNSDLYFINFVDNYQRIKELLNQEFNKSEALRQKIENICNNALFKLSNKEKNYVIGSYTIEGENEIKDNKIKRIRKKIKNENIDFKNLEDLNIKIQMTKKLSTDSKEKLNIFQNFIDLYNNIVIIQSLLKDIDVRGYPKEIKIYIKIINKEKQYEFYIEDSEKNNKNEDINKINNNIINKDKDKDKNIINIKDIFSKLKNIRENLKKSQKEGYKKNEYIRYIFGRQFSILYDHLKKKEINENFISHFLKYITNNQITNILKEYKWKNNEEDEFQDIIYNINEYIKQNLELNNINLEKIYSKTKIISEEYKGFYLYSCAEKDEKKLYQLYKIITGYSPVSQNILFCNNDTSKEEIESFLYRSILCKYNSCFMICGIELIEFSQKNYLIELLNEIITEYGNQMESCLIIISLNKNTDIHKSIESIKYKKTFNQLFLNEIENCFLTRSDNIHLVSSDKSGIGKSEKVKEIVLKSVNNDYIYFPLGGVFTRDELFNRLIKCKFKSESSIHLDLYDSDNIDLMTDFLFEIMILKSYKRKEDILMLPENIKIIIEIPNGFIDYELKFPILNLIPKQLREELLIKDISLLNVPQNILSNVQIVCNYLQLRKEKKLDIVDLIFPGITQEDLWKDEIKEKFENKKKGNRKKTKEVNEELPTTFIMAKIISQKECHKLIFDVFKEDKDEFPSYYQIKSFIDVLAEQLKIFNKSYILNADQLRRRNFKVVRSYILEGFINLTKYFTKAAYNKLLIEQKITHDKHFWNYDEQKDIRNGINKLADKNRNVISYDKIDSTLIFFHEGDGVMFKIITNKPKTDEEYQMFVKLLNSQIFISEKNKGKQKLIKELPNYNNFKKQKEFYEILKDILGIKNPLDEKEKEEKEKNSKKEKDKKEKNIPLKSIEEIAKDYIFTADNLIKMILILIRIRANVPVIMMGETGCGKTSLIKKLSELLNGSQYAMKIINIHAGMTDQEIIDYIIEYNSQAKKLIEIAKKNKDEKMKKLWIFLDEINTCKSMGLISELMCKRTYQGNKIEDNIVFIAACNPYRENKFSNDDEIALNINLAYKELKKVNDKDKKELEKNKNKIKLVYTVNPLPHSLLNFVFDFGSLKEKDEYKYIENMIDKPFNEIFYKNDINDENVGNKDELEEEKNEKKDKKEEENIIINEKDNKEIQLEIIKKFAINMISSAQNFIRNNTGISSVSLREIRKIIIFYKFFYEYLKFKKENYVNLKINIDDFPYQKLSKYELQIYSINLSIFICYYLRLTSEDLRKKLVDKLNKIFQNLSNEKIKFEDFLKLPIIEEKFIVDNIDIPKGIAKNRALLENIFSLFVCINNKIPLFIVGKPGCSKSLSVELILKSMKGEGISLIIIFLNIIRI